MAEKEKTEAVGGFKARIENFWYHYKWHSIIAVFVIAAVLVCSLQMCSKEKFDGFIMYAGGYAISRTESDDVAEYVKFSSSLSRVTPDTDGNGAKTPSFLDLYTPTDEEMGQGSSDMYINLSDDLSRLQYELVSGNEYYICFLSVANYEKYRLWGEIELFDPLAPFVPDGVEVEYYDDGAIYLRSLSFYKLDGINALPEDTVICLRKLSAVASIFDKKTNSRNRTNAELILTNILTFEK